jgi:hypothetical protein
MIGLFILIKKYVKASKENNEIEKKEIFEFVRIINDDKLQIFLCYFVYISYLLSDYFGLTVFKKFANFVNRLVFNLSGYKYLSS